jgi:transposase, IS5 family
LRPLKNLLLRPANRAKTAIAHSGGVFLQRINAEPTFTDLTVADLGGPNATTFFRRLAQAVDFTALAASIADVFKDADPSAGGRPHWPLVTMLKIVFLQKCFGLSDPMAEEMLKDRISFRRFVGLSFDDRTPDHSTLSIFRKRLLDHGHGVTLLDQTVQMLHARGLILKTGTLIDATIIEAPLGGKRADGSSSADPCTSKTVKGGRTYNGYRAHVSTDRQGLITDFVFDTAAESEHTHFDQLAQNETKAVYADSGCRSKERVAKLRSRGVLAGICHRRVRGQAELTPTQKRLNRLIAPIRAFVEHPFGWIKARLNNRRARYRGVRRNALDFSLSAVCWNWCRSLSLKPAVATA